MLGLTHAAARMFALPPRPCFILASGVASLPPHARAAAHAASTSEPCMPFAADIRHWPTAAALAAHLAQYDPAICSWVAGLTLHHTYRPTVAQWRGYSSMIGMRDFYIGKGWSAGPHLYVAPDGVWQLSPLNLEGVHATVCNKNRWGVEVVGDYDAAPWSQSLAELVYGTLAALFRWRGLSADRLNGHRDCNSPKTCPGRAIQLPAVRAELARRLTPSAESLSRNVALLSAPRCTQAQALAYLTRRATGEYTRADLALSLLPAYWQACTATGLDPCVAIAQLVHETGNLSSWWSQRPRRNPAGIGVTGDTKPARPIGGAWAQHGAVWEEGCSFASWADHAVPAHVGRLLAYATAPGSRTPRQTTLIRAALNVRSLPASYQGAAPTLAGLEGRWAVPGDGYADKLAAIMTELRGAHE